ncbi:hypothetical protein ZWY2020_033580 [Hordeum vulgare]|nr:hypothetical protein ZWY2020_033580 [Hordeum vulgare]
MASRRLDSGAVVSRGGSVHGAGMGTFFGQWFALRYLDSLNERAADMFKIRAAQLRRILLELCPVSFLF